MRLKTVCDLAAKAMATNVAKGVAKDKLYFKTR